MKRFLQHPIHALSFLPLFAAALLSGCGGSDGAAASDLSAANSFTGGDGSPKVRMADDTQAFLDVNPSVVEDLGSAPSMLIEEVTWGRLVSRVFRRDANGSRQLIHRNLVVDPSLLDGVRYRLRLDPLTANLCPDERRYASPPVLDPFDDPLAPFNAHHVLLTADPITLETELTIGPNIAVDGGVEEGCPDFEGTDPFFNFHVTIGAVVNGVETIEARGDSSTAVGPFDKVARNAAVLLRFSDLLEPSTISTETVQLFAGDPPVAPFRGRVFADPNYGRLVNIDGTGDPTPSNFRSTRIIVDFAVSPIEADDNTQINAVGLPPSTLPNAPNVSIRIPSQANFGGAQFQFLSNLTEHGLSTIGNGPVDTSTPAVPVIRAFRSGSVTDEGNGFLPDGTAPRLVAAVPVTITNFRPGDDVDVFKFTASFADEFLPCATRPLTGNLMEFNGFTAQLLRNASQLSEAEPNSWVSEARVFTTDAGSLPTQTASRTGVVLTPYISGENLIPLGCFLSVSPDPGTYPVADINPGSSLTLRFNEAMDPSSISPLEDFMVVRGATLTPGPLGIVPARMEVNDDLTQFTYTPELKFSYPNTFDALTPTAYYVLLGSDPNGLRDLAGNRLAAEPFDAPLQVRFDLDATSEFDRNAGVVLRFNELNEDGEFGPELDGQFSYDVDSGVINPRPVTRFSGIIDRSNPIIGNLMNDSVQQPGAVNPPLFLPLGGTFTIYDQDINDPLTRSGCRMMWAWRYCDMSLSTGQAPTQSINLRDEGLYNLDIDGLAWAAPNGAVQSDTFPEFAIWLAHAASSPDQGADFSGAVPQPWTQTGLKPGSFGQNVLADNTRPGGALVNVHPRARGYVIDPARSFLTATGRLMMPFPLNESADPSTHRYYTWRDTAIRTNGGDPNNYIESGNPNGGQSTIPPDDIFLSGNPLSLPFNSDPMSTVGGSKLAVDGGIPAFAMPLLVDLRTYPTSAASGLNVLDFSLSRVLSWGAVNVATPFRTFAAGGTNISGEQVLIDPDLAQPSGGFNEFVQAPVSVGSPTPPADEVFYMGQVDFVTRVSRAHSRWFAARPAGAPVVSDYSEPIVFPDAINQPLGTSIRVALRGASELPANSYPNSAMSVAISAQRSAGHLDAMGDLPKTENNLLLEYVPDDGMGTGMPGGGGGPAAAGAVCIDASFPPFADYSFLFSDDDTQSYVPSSERNPGINFVTASTELAADDWTSDPSDIAGAEFFQFRLTFINNVVSGARPAVDAIGFAVELAD